MKKQLTIFLLFFTSICLAQLRYGPRVSLGLSGLGGGNSGIGFQAGLFVNAELRDRIGIQPEVLFTVKNGNTKAEHTNASGGKSTIKTSYSFTYIDIPIYGYAPVSKHLTVLFGPQISTISKATSQKSGTGISGDEAKKQDVAETDTGMGIAVGLDVYSSSPIRFGVRFSTTPGAAFAGRSTLMALTVSYLMDW